MFLLQLKTPPLLLKKRFKIVLKEKKINHIINSTFNLFIIYKILFVIAHFSKNHLFLYLRVYALIAWFISLRNTSDYVVQLKQRSQLDAQIVQLQQVISYLDFLYVVPKVGIAKRFIKTGTCRNNFFTFNFKHTLALKLAGDICLEASLSIAEIINKRDRFGKYIAKHHLPIISRFKNFKRK